MSIKNFIPTIWSARLLDHLDKRHVYLNLLNRDYEGEIKSLGDTVKINQIGEVTVRDYTKGADIEAPEGVDGTQQILTIDQAKYFNFGVEDVDNAQTNPKLMDKAMERAAYAMNDVVDQFAANLLAVNVHADNMIGTEEVPEVPTAETAYDLLVDLGTKLSEANVRADGRWAVIPAFYHGLLLKDKRFVGNGTDYNKAILEGGEIGFAAGFTLHASNNVPNTNGTKYKIIAGTDEAGSYAEQLLETEAYRPEKRFSDAVKGLHVYGAKVLQSKCIAVLTANKK